MATETTSPADVARAIFAAFNAHDLDALASHYADTIDERLPDAHLRTRAELREYMGELFAGLPDAHMDVRSLVESGDAVLVRWVLTGTHTGTFQGLKPTGKRLEVDGFEEMTIRDGRLVTNVVSFDRLGLGQQLGLMPPDGSAPERGMKVLFNAGTSLKSRIAARRG